MATAAVRNGTQNDHETTSRLVVESPAAQRHNRSTVMLDHETNGSAETLQPARNLDLENYTTWADGITAGITGVIDQALLSDEADLLWSVSADILNRHALVSDPANAPYHRLSTVLLLEALIASPTAVQHALELLRSLLLEEDPEVAKLRAALEGKHTPPA